MNDPAQVLDVMRDVLLEHMDNEDALPNYRVQRALCLNAYGRIITADDIIDGDRQTGLLLTMRDGSELRLTLTQGVSGAP